MVPVVTALQHMEKLCCHETFHPVTIRASHCLLNGALKPKLPNLGEVITPSYLYFLLLKKSFKMSKEFQTSLPGSV